MLLCSSSLRIACPIHPPGHPSSSRCCSARRTVRQLARDIRASPSQALTFRETNWPATLWGASPSRANTPSAPHGSACALVQVHPPPHTPSAAAAVGRRSQADVDVY